MLVLPILKYEVMKQTPIVTCLGGLTRDIIHSFTFFKLVSSKVCTYRFYLNNSSKEYVQTAHIQSEITIEEPKDKVRKILADLGNIVKFHPFVTNSHYTSD